MARAPSRLRVTARGPSVKRLRALVNRLSGINFKTAVFPPSLSMTSDGFFGKTLYCGELTGGNGTLRGEGNRFRAGRGALFRTLLLVHPSDFPNFLGGLWGASFGASLLTF